MVSSIRPCPIQPCSRHGFALFLSRRVFEFLKGTGFKEDLDDVFARLEATLKRKDFVAARNLDGKVFDANEAPHLYGERLEDVNDITTALVREERLFATTASAEDTRHLSSSLTPFSSTLRGSTSSLN